MRPQRARAAPRRAAVPPRAAGAGGPPSGRRTGGAPRGTTGDAAVGRTGAPGGAAGSGAGHRRRARRCGAGRIAGRRQTWSRTCSSGYVAAEPRAAVEAHDSTRPAVRGDWSSPSRCAEVLDRAAQAVLGRDRRLVAEQLRARVRSGRRLSGSSGVAGDVASPRDELPVSRTIVSASSPHGHLVLGAAVDRAGLGRVEQQQDAPRPGRRRSRSTGSARRCRAR